MKLVGHAAVAVVMTIRFLSWARRSTRQGALPCAKVFGPAAILALGFLLTATPGTARPDYTRRTKQDCSYCHLPGGWFLTDAGKYFEQHRSLNGYKPPAEPSKQSSNQNPKSK